MDKISRRSLLGFLGLAPAAVAAGAVRTVAEPFAGYHCGGVIRQALPARFRVYGRDEQAGALFFECSSEGAISWHAELDRKVAEGVRKAIEVAGKRVPATLAEHQRRFG